MGRRNQFLSKHVRETATQGWPEPKGEEFVVQLVRSRGGNTMECKLPDGAEVLCWLPSKLNKVVWAQRGDYLIVDPSSEAEAGGKVTCTIVHILFPEQVGHLRKIGKWPEGFQPSETQAQEKQPPANQEGGGEGGARAAQGGVDGVAEGVAGLVVGEVARRGEPGDAGGEGSEESDGDDDDLFVNRNGMHEDSWEESAESEEEGDDGI